MRMRGPSSHNEKTCDLHRNEQRYVDSGKELDAFETNNGYLSCSAINGLSYLDRSSFRGEDEAIFEKIKETREIAPMSRK
jgi:hypothetical protein